MPQISITSRKDFNKLAVFKFNRGSDEEFECKAWITDADHWGLKVGATGNAKFVEEEYQGKTSQRIAEWNGEGPPKRSGGGARSSPEREANIKACSDNKNASILACCAMNNAVALLVARAAQDPDFAKTLSPTLVKAWTMDFQRILSSLSGTAEVNPFKED